MRVDDVARIMWQRPYGGEVQVGARGPAAALEPQHDGLALAQDGILVLLVEDPVSRGGGGAGEGRGEGVRERG